MQNAAVDLGASKNAAKEQLTDVVEFMQELYKIGFCDVASNFPLSTTLGEAETLFGSNLLGHPPTWTSFFTN